MLQFTTYLSSIRVPNTVCLHKYQSISGLHFNNLGLTHRDLVPK